MVHWWGKNQVAEKCRSAILTTYETDLYIEDPVKSMETIGPPYKYGRYRA